VAQRRFKPAATALLTVAGLVGGLALAPSRAQALERVQMRLPLLETDFTVELSELSSPASLLAGNSDLAELDRATDGAVGRKFVDLFNAPLPLQVTAVVDTSATSPLLNQALLLVSALGGIDGLPEPFTGEDLSRVLDQAAAKGPLTMLTVLRALPGKTATLDLSRALFAVQRLARQQQPADTLLAAQPAAAEDPALRSAGPLATQRAELTIPVAYRPQPLSVVVVRPTTGANNRLVVISHGLWDSPESFEGWGRHLASHGYTVLLPRHPGSDRQQQSAMLSGKVPPPGPEELRMRPLDVSAVIDAVAAGGLGLPPGIRTDSVVAMGQSWGATTVLQLAGARPSDTRLTEFCNDPFDPSRNLSWILQCSFLTSANTAALADPRIKAVVAVSPPMSLLFASGAAQSISSRVLLVSGSRDWVVPAGPEAITPMSLEARNAGGGHSLVLAKGGDHFNLGSTYEVGGGVLRGLLLAWTNAAYAAGPAVAPRSGAPQLLPANGWGDTTIPLVDVTGALRERTP
jgi:predicted dienelactone hydrolase